MEIPVNLDAWLQEALYHYLLVFARIGTAFMMLPGFADAGVPARTRLAGGLAVAFAITPVLSPDLPAPPGDPLKLALALLAEIVAGAFLGGIIRVIMGALHVAGATMAQNMLLSNIFGGGGTAFMGATTISATLMLGAITVIFASGLHLPMLAAVIESYRVIPAAAFPEPQMLGRMAERGGLKMFGLAAQLAAPFLALGFLVKMAMGFINRANQKMPVFFVAIPLVIAGGLLLLALTAPAILQEFRAEFAAWIAMLRGQ
jgi:flagellar biosynthetic protein FliR